MREAWSYAKVLLLALVVVLLLTIFGSVLMSFFATLFSQTVGAQPVALVQAQHPAGTRILESCTLKIPADECVMEKVVMDWSPSGRFVKLAAVGFSTPGEWKLPRQVRIVEILAVPKAEPVKGTK